MYLGYITQYISKTKLFIYLLIFSIVVHKLFQNTSIKVQVFFCRSIYNSAEGKVIWCFHKNLIKYSCEESVVTPSGWVPQEKHLCMLLTHANEKKIHRFANVFKGGFLVLVNCLIYVIVFIYELFKVHLLMKLMVSYLYLVKL